MTTPKMTSAIGGFGIYSFSFDGRTIVWDWSDPVPVMVVRGQDGKECVSRVRNPAFHVQPGKNMAKRTMEAARLFFAPLVEDDPA